MRSAGDARPVWEASFGDASVLLGIASNLLSLSYRVLSIPFQRFGIAGLGIKAAAGVGIISHCHPPVQAPERGCHWSRFVDWLAGF